MLLSRPIKHAVKKSGPFLICMGLTDVYISLSSRHNTMIRCKNDFNHSQLNMFLTIYYISTGTNYYIFPCVCFAFFKKIFLVGFFSDHLDGVWLHFWLKRRLHIQFVKPFGVLFGPTIVSLGSKTFGKIFDPNI